MYKTNDKTVTVYDAHSSHQLQKVSFSFAFISKFLGYQNDYC